MKVPVRSNRYRLDTFAAEEHGSSVCVTAHRNRVIVRVTDQNGEKAHFDCTLEQLAGLLVVAATNFQKY